MVLRNLVNNALDAVTSQGNRGTVTISVSVSGADVLIQVRDDGGGITPAQAVSIFDPGVSAKVGGMGIGLGICRAIVEAHGGRLWAVPGPAGHFCFTLALDANAIDGGPS